MKTLLVIGASSDIGSELIMRVANNYDVVWAHYFHWNDKLEAIKSIYGEKIRFVDADLLNNLNVDKMIEKIKVSDAQPDHIVFLPMTKYIAQRFTKTNLKSFNDGWSLSILSNVNILQSFLPFMQKNKKGKVLFMLTTCTIGIPPKFQTSYVTVKYAMLGLLKSLASEYADKGITFNGVSPDMINTKYISDLPHILIEQYADSRPNKQLLTVLDVIPTFEFLLSDAANSINGENICIR